MHHVWLFAGNRRRCLFIQLQGAIPEEAAFDRFEASHAINFFDLNCKYADVIPTAEVETYLEGLAPR
jgi:hypothetical protein